MYLNTRKKNTNWIREKIKQNQSPDYMNRKKWQQAGYCGPKPRQEIDKAWD